MPDIVKLRFSTKRLKRLIDELKPDQKDFLHRNGLGAFIHIKDFHVPIPMLEWVMRIHRGHYSKCDWASPGWNRSV